ncbi:hypothetical protein B0G83_116109 [Paraburkholderia sp. BL21I4N1]|nr:hypothetical protein B0G83_116109 [Paraburkholderia sp. BL21I4N1]
MAAIPSGSAGALTADAVALFVRERVLVSLPLPVLMPMRLLAQAA